MKPNLFIVGAPKSGTSSMEYYLKQHPDIYFSPRKETHFFSRDYKAPLYITNQNEYKILFETANNYKIIGESSVYYLYSKSAPDLIKKYNPNSKIIIMLRNPIEMTHSLHSQLIYSGVENISDFEKALNEEENRKKHHINMTKNKFSFNHMFYSDIANYLPNVKRYYSVFGEENVHTIIFDKLKSDVKKVYKEALDFLNITNNYVPNYKIVNPNQVTRSHLLRKIILYPGSKTSKTIKTIIPSSKLRILIKSFLSKINTENKSRLPIKDKFRCELETKFLSNLDNLSDLIKQDLSCWGK